MPIDLSRRLVIGISSRALFDFDREHAIFREGGVDAYKAHQKFFEDAMPQPGAGMALVKGLLRTNDNARRERRVEVVLFSRNSPSSSLRLANALRNYELDVRFASLTGGDEVVPYLRAYDVGLFLTADQRDLRIATAAGIPSAKVMPHPVHHQPVRDEIRVALDGDCVLFGEESELRYQHYGIEKFIDHEVSNARRPVAVGPLTQFLHSLAALKQACRGERLRVKIALVTSRNLTAFERIIRTLQEWDIEIDHAHCTGGIDKSRILQVFQPHLFIDDDCGHCERAQAHVPTAQTHASARA